MSEQIGRSEQITILFLYGLVYFSMGVMILAAVRRPSRLALTAAVPWLAASGIVHGARKWLEIPVLLEPRLLSGFAVVAFGILQLAFLSISLTLLFQAGVELWVRMRAPGKATVVWRLLPSFFFLAWLLATGACWNWQGSRAALVAGDALARYMLFLPSLSAVGIAFFAFSRSLAAQGYARAGYASLLVAIFCIAKMPFSALLVPRASFWPASVLNDQAFYTTIGIPLDLFRLITTIGFTASVILTATVFNTEQERLEAHRLAEADLVERLARGVPAAPSVSEAMPQVLEDLLAFLPVNGGAVYTRNPETDELLLEAAAGLSDQYVSTHPGFPVGKGRGVLGPEALSGGILADQVAKHPEVGEMLSDPSGHGYFAIVPFVSGGRSLGAVLLFTPKGQALGEDYRRLLEAVGSRLGITMENTLLEEQRRVAHTLQESLLSPVPEIEGLEIGVRYRPATAGMVIGGDFHDFIRLPSGLAVTVGDVSGKGRLAAAKTAEAKNTVAAFLREDPSPAAALSRANRVLAESVPVGQFVTVAVLIWNPDSSYTYASAGHPPALMSNSTCRYLSPVQGPPLGALKTSTYREHRGTLRPSECLILYTDGLTDARRESRFLGEAGVIDAARHLVGKSAQDTADGLSTAATDFAGGKLGDDLMVVVLRPSRLTDLDQSGRDRSDLDDSNPEDRARAS